MIEQQPLEETSVTIRRTFLQWTAIAMATAVDVSIVVENRSGAGGSIGSAWPRKMRS